MVVAWQIGMDATHMDAKHMDARCMDATHACGCEMDVTYPCLSDTHACYLPMSIAMPNALPCADSMPDNHGPTLGTSTYMPHTLGTSTYMPHTLGTWTCIHLHARALAIWPSAISYTAHTVPSHTPSII